MKILEDNQPRPAALKKLVACLRWVRGICWSFFLLARTLLLPPACDHVGPGRWALLVLSGSLLPLPWQGSGITPACVESLYLSDAGFWELEGRQALPLQAADGGMEVLRGHVIPWRDN